MRDPGFLVRVNFAEETDAFDHGGLVEASEGGVREAVGGKCLTEGEEVAAEGAFEADVVGAERPAVVLVPVEGGEGKREDTPY